MDDEYIHLRDYVKILWKRKWIIILMPLISIFTTGAVIFVFQGSKPEINNFETTVVVQNGYISADMGLLKRPIIEKAEGFEMIKNMDPDLADKIQFENKPDALTFEMKIKNDNPDRFKKIAQDYIEDGNELYNKQIEVCRERIAALNKQKEIVEDNIGGITSILPKLSSKNDTNEIQTIIFIQDYKEKLNNAKIQILEIENKIYEINLVISNSRPFTIISPFKIIEAKEKTMDNKSKLLLSAVFGLMGAVLLAFAIENWNKA